MGELIRDTYESFNWLGYNDGLAGAERKTDVPDEYQLDYSDGYKDGSLKRKFDAEDAARP